MHPLVRYRHQLTRTVFCLHTRLCELNPPHSLSDMLEHTSLSLMDPSGGQEGPHSLVMTANLMASLERLVAQCIRSEISLNI